MVLQGTHGAAGNTIALQETPKAAAACMKRKLLCMSCMNGHMQAGQGLLPGRPTLVHVTNRNQTCLWEQHPHLCPAVNVNVQRQRSLLCHMQVLMQRYMVVQDATAW